MADLVKIAATPRKRRLWPRTWRGRLLTGLGMLLVVLAIAWSLSRATPPWYQPLDRTDDAVIDNAALGQKLLLELHNKIERVPLHEQEWMITQDVINSLLAIQFVPPSPSTTAPRIPVKMPLISDPIVVFTPGKVTLACRSSRIPGGDPRGGVGSLVFTVGIVPGDDGRRVGLVKLNSVWIGDLPMPRSIAGSRLQAIQPLIAALVEDVLSFQDTSTRRRPSPDEFAKITSDVQQVVADIIASKPFPLEHTVNRKQIVIKELLVEDGQFTVVLAPPTPAVVAPRPPG